MRAEILFFASTRDIAGVRSLYLECEPGVTLDGVLDQLVQRFPGLSGLRPSVQVAVNREYVSRDHEVCDGDEIALIPPVSGGGRQQDHYRIVEAPLAADALHEQVLSPLDGAVVTFAGTVRKVTGEQETSHLFYEAYAPMAERKMAQVAEEARQRWPVGQIAVQHRIGRLEVGEISILASVASPHRGEAFEACRYVIDRLKAEVPIWKKEFGPEGDYWVEGPTPGEAGSS